jgi:hypothetical protein
MLMPHLKITFGDDEAEASDHKLPAAEHTAYTPVYLTFGVLNVTLSQSIYSGAKKYLVSHQLRKFPRLKRRERPVIFIIGTLNYDRQNYFKNPENRIVGYLMNLFANYGGK